MCCEVFVLIVREDILSMEYLKKTEYTVALFKDMFQKETTAKHTLTI